jgi:energy-coupling factor transporter ATP-binding protein EcfA2
LQEQYGLRVDPKAKIWQLSVGEQQRVEILKTLYRGANVLIFDEPTAVLAPQEIDELIATMRSLVAQGKSIIFISHKLHEVTAVADRITVLRKGRVTAQGLPMAGRTRHELAQLMVGRDVVFQIKKEPHTPGEVVLRVDGVHALNNKGAPALRGVSLDVRAGEIVGIAGVAGNGQSELAECITGLRDCTSARFRSPGQRHQPAAAGGHPGRRGPHPRGSQPRRFFAQPDHHRQRDHEALSRRPHRQRHDHQRCDGAGIRAHAEDNLRHPGAERADAGAQTVRRQSAKGDPGAGDQHDAEGDRRRAADARAGCRRGGGDPASPAGQQRMADTAMC